MKKTAGLLILMLITVLVMFGCSGAGGGTSATSDGGNAVSNPGGGPQPSAGSTTTSFALNLVDYRSTAVARTTVPDPSTDTGANLPAPSNVRVVMWTTTLQPTTIDVCDQYVDNGAGDVICITSHTEPGPSIPTKTLWKIQDATYSGPTLTLQIPTGSIFTLDVITNKLEGSNHSILKYGEAMIDLTSQTTPTSKSVVMKTVDQILNMMVPDSVISEGKFNVTLSSDRLPFSSTYKMTMSAVGTSPSFTPVTSDPSSANTLGFTAPSSTTAGTISLQGTFTLDSRFLTKDDIVSNWTRTFPNPTYSESVSGSLLQLIPVYVGL